MRIRTAMLLLTLLSAGCGDTPTEAGSAPAADVFGISQPDIGPTAVAVACSNGQDCDDGNACTSDDACRDGQCVGTFMECDDGAECTFDRCVDGVCESTLISGKWCRIDGACVADGAVSADNPCLGCVAPILPTGWSPHDGGVCDDGLDCTETERCNSGACVGQPVNCDDGNQCTTDGCTEAAGCITAPLNGPCEDGDFCTLGDQCTNGSCITGTLHLDCEDGDSCTLDVCLAGGGCQHEVHSAACSDGDPCTVGDLCVFGDCVGGTGALDCDDSNACTTDSCKASAGCIQVPNLDGCDDGDPCSVGDVCSGASCLSGLGAMECNDGSPCTLDLCEFAKGCAHVPALGSCDDADPCTADDTCAGGTCIGTSIADCSDGDVCTSDWCDSDLGCLNPYNEAPCDDGNPCTTDDECVLGDCLPTAGACDDKNACTTDLCIDGDGAPQCVHELANTDECQIQITITHPARATMLSGPKVVTVTGRVTSPAAPVAVAKLNGEPLTLNSSGHFVRTMVATHGINRLVAEATDTLGNVDTSVQTFLFSKVYTPMHAGFPSASVIGGAAQLALGTSVLDDGNHAPDDADDIATLLELLLGAFDLGALLPNPLLDSDAYLVTSHDFQAAAPTVQVLAQNGGLRLLLRVVDISAGLDATGLCSVCPDATGGFTIAELLVVAQFDVSATGGVPVVTLQTADAALLGLDVDFDGALGELIDPIVDFLLDDFVPSLEQTLEGQLAGILPTTLEGALASLAFDLQFDVPALADGAPSVPISLKTGLQDTFWDDDGGQLRLWASATTPKVTSHDALGSVGRGACLTGGTEVLDIPPGAPLQFALGDDLINQILFSLWWGGGLNFDVPSDWLSGVDLSDAGITELALTVDFHLPPVLTGCTQFAEPVLQLGDVRVAASMTLFGAPVELDLFLSATAYVVFNISNDELTLSAPDIESLDTEVVVNTAGFKSAETLVEDLVASQVGPILVELLAGSALFGIPLPDIDLGSFTELLPVDTAIGIDTKQVFRQLGWWIVAGDVK